MKLTGKYFKYRKGEGTIHISHTGYTMTLCMAKMDQINTCYGTSKEVECPVCVETYIEETGHLIRVKKEDESGLQMNLF